MKSLLLALLFIIPVSIHSYEETTLIAKPAQQQLSNHNPEECTYWITKSSRKRHNKNCRYYKNSKGYCTEDPDEGIACKICGG